MINFTNSIKYNFKNNLIFANMWQSAVAERNRLSNEIETRYNKIIFFNVITGNNFYIEDQTRGQINGDRSSRVIQLSDQSLTNKTITVNINGEISTKFFAVKLHTRIIVERYSVKKYNASLSVKITEEGLKVMAYNAF